MENQIGSLENTGTALSAVVEKCINLENDAVPQADDSQPSAQSRDSCKVGQTQYKVDWRTRYWKTGTHRARRIKLLVNDKEYISPWVLSTRNLVWRWRNYIFTQDAYIQGQPPQEMIVFKEALRSREYTGTLMIGFVDNEAD